MDELLEICEAKKAPKVVTSAIASLIAHDERKLFCWMGDPAPALGVVAVSKAGLYESDLLKELVSAARALDWEKIIVRVHEVMFPPSEIEITPEMIAAGTKTLSECPVEFFEPEGIVVEVYRAMRRLQPFV